MSTSKNPFNIPTIADTHFKITALSKGRTLLNQNNFPYKNVADILF
jgi:hypothetical protein